MSRINIGKVAPIPKGDWVQSQPYEKLNMVSKSGVLYIAKQDVPADTAITNTNYWMQASEQLSIGTVETVSASTGASATITNGTNGPELNLSIPRGVTGNESIDDTKGKGDTDYVWSADKNYEEINKLYNNKLDTTKTSELSDSIVTFEAENDHTIRDLTVEINPVQDLHGQDAPYPAGSGTNKFQSALCATKETATDNGIDFKYVATTESFTITGTVLSGNAINAYLLGSYNATNPVFTLPADTYTFSVTSGIGVVFYSYDGTTRKTFDCTESGNTYTFTSDVSITALKPRNRIQGNTYNESFKIQIEKGSAKSDWTPYENICPITGWDEVNITRTGKNLLPKTDTSATTRNGITFTPQEDGSIKVYGTATAQADFTLHTANSLSIAKNGIYTYSCQGISTNVRLVVGGGSNTSGLNYTELGLSQYGNTKTQTLKKGTLGHCFIRVANSATVDTILYPQFELGSSASGYEPYQSTEVTVDLGDTRYGGTLDVTTGVLTVTKFGFNATSDLGYGTSSQGTNCNVFQISLSYNSLPSAKAYTAKSNRFSGNIPSDTSGRMVHSGSMIYFVISKLEVEYNIESLKTWLDNHSTQFVYELAEPQTIQLTLEEISTLIGKNNLWANTGDSTIMLRLPTGDLAYQDTVDYETQITNKPNFGSMLSESEDSLTATKNYNKDTLISIGDSLYKTLVNISSGSALVIGSNIATTTIETELALKANSSDVYTKAEVENYVESEITTYHDDTKATAITESVSGNIVNFTDGANSTVEDLKINIEPVQNLHGQDAPYPAGGGKNLCNPDTLIVGYYGNAGGYESSSNYRSSALIPVNPNTQYYSSLYDKSGTRISGLVFTEWDANEQIIGQNTSNPITTSATTAFIRIRNFDAQTSYITENNFNYQVEQGSSATSYAPYSNICPISGWDEAVVTRTGKNLYPISSFTSTSTARYCNTDGVFLKSGQNYTFSGVMSTSESDRRVIVFLLENSAITQSTGDPSSYINRYIIQPTNLVKFSQNITVTKDCYLYVKVVSANSTLSDIQLELGSTATAYEPYQGQTVTIDLDGTIYGGTLNVLTGEMTVDRVGYDMGSLNWTHVSPSGSVVYDYFKIVVSGITPHLRKTLCSMYPLVSAAVVATSGYDKCIAVGGSTIFVADSSYTDAATFKSAVNGQYVVCVLATPLTVQLTPSQLSTLLGQNNIWADTGNTEVTYRADTKLYIQKLTQPTEDDMIANNNIEANKFFMIGNSLYYSTIAIAIGTSIIPGDNCTKLSLADALNNLNS